MRCNGSEVTELIVNTSILSNSPAKRGFVISARTFTSGRGDVTQVLDPFGSLPYSDRMRLHSKSILLVFPLVILIITLFPFGWLAQHWPAFDTFAGWLFPEPWGHFFGHLTIFLLVGLSLLLAFSKLRTSPRFYALLALTIAVGQEAIQLLYKRRAIVLNDITDLIPDLLGATMAWLIVYIISNRPDVVSPKVK